MRVCTDVPAGLAGRGIGPPLLARGFGLSLDVAEPWGGGAIAGRVEATAGHADPHPLRVRVACTAAWVDVAPQLVGQAGLRLSMAYELRARARPIWLDDVVWTETVDVGALDGSVHWRPFSIRLPDHLPRAFEGTLCAFRYVVEASRRRRVGRVTASCPLLVETERTLPVVRIETTPVGTWRLLEWRAEDEPPTTAGAVSVAFDDRSPADWPQPGEGREEEILRRTGRVASGG